MSTLKVAACILPMVLGFLSAVHPQVSDEIVAIVLEQWVTFADGSKDKRLYRGYTITQDATNIPNLISFICPKDRSALAHLTFHLGKP